MPKRHDSKQTDLMKSLIPDYSLFCDGAFKNMDELRLLAKSFRFQEVPKLIDSFGHYVGVLENPVLRRAYFATDALINSYKWVKLAYPDNARFLTLLSKTEIVTHYRHHPKTEVRQAVQRVLKRWKFFVSINAEHTQKPNVDNPKESDFVVAYTYLSTACYLFQMFAVFIRETEFTRMTIANKLPRSFEGYLQPPPMPEKEVYSIIKGVPMLFSPLLVLTLQYQNKDKLGTTPINVCFQADVHKVKKVKIFPYFCFLNDENVLICFC